jgi:hypothetical protein
LEDIRRWWTAEHAKADFGFARDRAQPIPLANPVLKKLSGLVKLSDDAYAWSPDVSDSERLSEVLRACQALVNYKPTLTTG